MVFGLKLGLPKATKTSAESPDKSSKAESSGRSGSKGERSGGGGKGALTVNEFVARTKRYRERGLEPTKPELIAYARYLGIDPITDGDLMWIADEALAAPLPSEWTEHHDSADRVFYYNVQTHASSWTHPLEQMHRDTYKSIVHYRSGEVSKEDQVTELERLKRKCDDAERESIRELQAWSEHTDEGGQKFYYNREKQVSVWTDPRPARCHALYLQMRALRDMSKHCGQAVPGLGPMDDPRRDKLRIQQMLVMGNVDPLGRSTRDKAKEEDSSSRMAGADASATGKDEEKKKKKKHKEGKHKKEGNEELLDLTEDGDGDVGAPDIFNKKSGLDVKKPSLSAVEEVRQALGVPGSSNAGSSNQPSPHALPSAGGGGLPSINQGSFGARLPTPPGDGLSSVGRAKVRAGIRLERRAEFFLHCTWRRVVNV
ncbi:CEP164 [Symbiodinium pilosum]|uniref:CEP164 protein n=1 Tax=Symbiodinium pilosum TaxID=2952 RepID=A0A812WF89_SYMPI|nr:CEP164 [Symbiodinium pilosum]